ncbi:uncharacterized protein JCM6883_006054 [Sporobolomyces salmoneus]|uniref:uncharacterized protein n=1 Tax=Sporobolomyces salmoneus TaxID=183962 RepID=UPI00316BB8F0
MSNMMQRTSSMCSLPSPPADTRMNLSDDEEEMEEEDFNVMNGRNRHSNPSMALSRASKRSHTLLSQSPREDEVDELASDDNEESTSDEPPLKKRNTSKRLATLALGSPVNVSTATSASRASRKQLLNPFFLSSSSSSDSHSTSSSTTCRPPQNVSSSPEHPHNLTSPTRHSRRRVDPDRIKLNQNITPPQKTRSQLQEERLREEEEEELRKRREMMGWDDPDNPFLDNNDEMFKRNQSKGELKRPETLTYVKRGERIHTSIPFTAVLTSSCPADDPFTYTTPKLLFPPAPPKIPSTPPSSFLQALRASSSTSTTAEPQEAVAAVNKPHGHDERTAELPPTPVTMKRPNKVARSHLRGNDDAASLSSGSGYKRMRLPTSEVSHQQQRQQQRNGLRQ